MKDCIFNDYIIEDKGVLEFNIKMLQKEGDFKNNLYKMIELSKTSKEIEYAASNAISLLNAA